MGDRSAARLLETSFTQEQLTPAKIERFYNESGSSIAADTWVMIDTSKSTYGLGHSIVPLDTDTNADAAVMCVGVTRAAIADDEWGDVTTYGVHEGAAVTTGVTAGGVTAGSTAGRAENFTLATQHPIGTLLETAASNVGDVFVKCRG